VLEEIEFPVERRGMGALSALLVVLDLPAEAPSMK
jgi:hypothetical protein